MRFSILILAVAALIAVQAASIDVEPAADVAIPAEAFGGRRCWKISKDEYYCEGDLWNMESCPSSRVSESRLTLSVSHSFIEIATCC